MANLSSISWIKFVQRLHRLGFEGPYQGGKHPSKAYLRVARRQLAMAETMIKATGQVDRLKVEDF